MYGYPKQKISSCLNLNLKFKFEIQIEIWWAYYTDLPDHVHPNFFKTMKSSLRYGSYKFALQILNPTDPEGKCEFEWPHTPNFDVNP